MFKVSFLQTAIFIIVTTLVACANPGVMQLSENTYVVSRSSAAGAFTNMAKLRASTIQEANTFAMSKGKVAVAISDREVVPQTGFPSYEYQFMLVDADDPRATDATLSKRAETVSERTENIEFTNHSADEGGDVYTELLKLDNLRQRGILTDAEFDEQKRKILEGDQP